MVYYPDVEIQCANGCGSWKWSGGKIRALEGAVPDVCGVCFADPSLELIILVCQNKACNESFDYPPRWQKNIEKKGHSEPALCDTCREANQNQEPVTIKCEACSIGYTYSRKYVITWKRKEGWWDDREALCKPCFLNPERAEKLKKEKEKKEKRKQEEEEEGDTQQDIVGYYLRNYGTDEENKFWQSVVVDNDSYYVPSNVSSYDVSDEADWYASVPDRVGKQGRPIPRTVLGHIMQGSSGEGHGWEEKLGTNNPQTVVSLPANIAEDTNGDIIECTEKRFIIKYDTSRGVVVFIVDNEYAPPSHRLNSSYSPSQSSVASKIRDKQWKLS